jgi:hypothetical protein
MSEQLENMICSEDPADIRLALSYLEQDHTLEDIKRMCNTIMRQRNTTWRIWGRYSHPSKTMEELLIMTNYGHKHAV